MPSNHKEEPKNSKDDQTAMEFDLALEVDPEKTYFNITNDGHGHRAKLEHATSPITVKIINIIVENDPAFKSVPPLQRVASFQRNAEWQEIGRRYPKITDPKARAQLDKLFFVQAEQERRANTTAHLAWCESHVNETRAFLEAMVIAQRWMDISLALEAEKKALASGDIWAPHVEPLQGIVDEYAKKLQDATT